MSDIMLDVVTNDVAIIEGDLFLVDGSDAVAQNLMQRLKVYRGEWFLDLDTGVPYFQDILRKSPNPMAIDTGLKTVIIDTPGVVELTKFELSFDRAGRAIGLDFSCDTTDGPLDFTDISIGGA